MATQLTDADGKRLDDILEVDEERNANAVSHAKDRLTERSDQQDGPVTEPPADNPAPSGDNPDGAGEGGEGEGESGAGTKPGDLEMMAGIPSIFDQKPEMMKTSTQSMVIDESVVGKEISGSRHGSAPKFDDYDMEEYDEDDDEYYEDDDEYEDEYYEEQEQPAESGEAAHDQGDQRPEGQEADPEAPAAATGGDEAAPTAAAEGEGAGEQQAAAEGVGQAQEGEEQRPAEQPQEGAKTGEEGETPEKLPDGNDGAEGTATATATATEAAAAAAAGETAEEKNAEAAAEAEPEAPKGGLLKRRRRRKRITRREAQARRDRKAQQVSDSSAPEEEDEKVDDADEFSLAVFKTDERCSEIYIERLMGAWQRLRRDYQAMQMALTQLGLSFINARHNEIKQMCKPKVINARAVIATWPENLQRLVYRYESMKDHEFRKERRRNWRRIDLLWFVLRMVRVFAIVAISVKKYYIDEEFMKKVTEMRQKAALHANVGGPSTSTMISQQRKLTDMQKSLKASTISVAPPNTCIVNHTQRRLLKMIANGTLRLNAKGSFSIENGTNFEEMLAEASQTRNGQKAANSKLNSDDRSSSPRRNSALDELMDSLTRAPRYRTKLDAKLIGRFLRTAGSFSMLLPSDKEDECGMHVEFAHYDDGRLIARQGSRLDAFYYVVLGSIEKLKQAQLGNMDVTKSFGLIERGRATGFEDIDSNGDRECHYVARGKLEVLILPKKSYEEIINATGNVLDFLKRQHSGIFDTLPEQIDEIPTCKVIFYQPGAVVCSITKSMTWVYVVKSGRVKVVRKQPIYVTKDTKNTDATEREKPIKFAEGVAGVKFPQQIAKAAVCEHEREIHREKLAIAEAASNDDDATDLPNSCEPEALLSQVLGHPPIVKRGAKGVQKLKLPPVPKSKWDAQKKPPTSAARDVNTTCRKVSKQISRLIEFEQLNSLAATDPERGRNQQKQFSELPTRVAYVVIDSLGEGDIIGLWHFDGDKAKAMRSASGNDDKIVLISDGAELIKISKRVFLDNASNNALVKVETLLKQFVDEDEARDKLYERQEWESFKSRKLKDFL